MININKLSVSFGDQDLFVNTSIFIANKDKIGLVGKNGAGKSTFLKIINGTQAYNSGNIAIPKDCLIGYLPQEMKHSEHNTVLQEAALAFEILNKLEQRVEAISNELLDRTDYQSESYANILDELNDLNDRIHILGGNNKDQSIERVLKGLGFVHEDMDKPLSELSGGWKMRVELAKILLKAPHLMLLDEPTNHLDIESIEWLEGFLKNYPGALILISHDRDFLDNITKRTIEISNKKAYDYKFSYSKYLIKREEELILQKQAYKNQQKFIAETEVLINKFRAKKTKAAFAQSLIKKLEKLDIIEVDDFENTKINITLQPAPHSGKVVVETENLEKYYGDKHVFSSINLTINKQEKITLVGKNGMGKTTLIKILTDREKANGSCKIGHNVSIGYFAQDETSHLDDKKTVFEIVDAAAVGAVRSNIRSILGSFLFSGDDIDKKVSVLSGGEKTRLALCKLLLQPYNLLILDEPTNHLDLKSKQVLKEALMKYDGAMILVSHDRNFLHELVTTIYEVTPSGLKQYIGDIYDFLKEKKSESIADFETHKIKEEIKAGQSNTNKHSYEKNKEIKNLKNKIKKLEKQIEQHEVELTRLGEEVGNLNYNDKDATTQTLVAYDEAKQLSDKLMIAWEEAEKKLTELER